MNFRAHHLFQILKRFEKQYLPLDLFLSIYFRANKALGAKDRKFIAEAIYGMTRWRGLLDYLVGPHPTWEKRYALYQGFQPAHYLFVNNIPLYIRVSFPEDLFSHLLSQYGEEKAIQIAQATNEAAPTTIRINPLKTSREALLEKWRPHYEIEPSFHSPLGIQFKKRVPFFEMPEFKEGFFEVQDEASQLVACKVKAKPGDLILDYCAGSGGKSLAFAHLLQGKGQLFLHDVRPLALEQAKKRLHRAGIQNAQLLQPHHPNIQKLKKKMDWVLVDVPCSGTGTLRRNPDMKWKFSNEMLKNLVSEQRVIFEKALSYVRPLGHIVYATCSLLKEENELQAAHFLKTYPLESSDAPFSSLPTFNQMDGFYAVSFKKIK